MDSKVTVIAVISAMLMLQIDYAIIHKMNIYHLVLRVDGMVKLIVVCAFGLSRLPKNKY